MNIDPNVLELVEVLNEIDGIETSGSCGGHISPEKGQESEGSFYVCFDIDTGFLEVLEHLAWAADHPDISLSAWYDGGLMWELKGNDIDPDFIVQRLRMHVKEQNRTKLEEMMQSGIDYSDAYKKVF